jgi:hypothetical protein
MNLMTELKTFKLGRNPFTGGFPDMRTLTKLVQFNCNFCALTGPELDIFDNVSTAPLFERCTLKKSNF